MGDKALVVFKDSSGIVSPAVYLHWLGFAVPWLIVRLKERMKSRTGDAGYAAGRFCGIACETDAGGNLSIGMMNLTDTEIEAVKKEDEEALAEISQGDAGLVVVDCADFSWKAYDSYLGKEEETDDEPA